MAGRDDIRGTIGERMEGGGWIEYDPDGRLVEIDDRPARPGDEERAARILAHNKAWWDSLPGGRGGGDAA